MSNDSSRLPGLLRAGGLFLAAAVGPAVALTTLPNLRANPLLAALLLFAYELFILCVGFVSAVLRNLHDKWADRTAEALDAWIQRRISPFTGKYLRYMVASTRYMDVKGLSTQGEYTLEMRDVLVRLSLVATPLHQLSPHPLLRVSDENKKVDDGTVWHWLRRAQKDGTVLAIIGPPGSGKTTLIRHIAYTLGRGGLPALRLDAPSRVPVVVNLREHKNWSNDSTPTMVDLIRRNLTHVDHPEPSGWVESNLRRGNFLVMLDGLDEMPDSEVRRSLTAWLEQQASSQTGNIIIVTSRPFGYKDNPLSGATVAEVQPFSSAQINGFVRQWYQAISARSHGGWNDSSKLAAKTGAADLLTRLQAAPKLADLTANPLLLTMIANVHHYRGALPGSRSELYQEICEVFLGKRHQARGVPVDLPSRQKQTVLRVLAFEMMREEVSEITASRACEFIEDALVRVSDKLTPAEFLRSVEESSGLLIEKERGTVAFAHLTFQEFLAADHIREHGKIVDLLGDIASPWWRETFLLYAAIADATPIVEVCLAQAASPSIVALAAQCVEEAREVTAEMRSLLSSVVSPTDASKNPASRRAAAQVRLLLRSSRDIPLKQDHFISSEITCVEYQYFLDSISENRVPDHWTAHVFPQGMEDKPVLGIRREDAIAFTHWMRGETASGRTIRMPHLDEVVTALQRDGFSARPGLHQYWTLGGHESLRDAGFSVLMRGAPNFHRKDPYPTLANPASSNFFRDLLQDDLAAAGSYVEPTLIEDVLMKMWQETRSCDIGQSGHQMVLAEQLVSQYLKHRKERQANERKSFDRTRENYGELVEELQKQSNLLGFIGREALSRSTSNRRQAPRLVAARREARATALRCGGLAAALFMADAGSNELRSPGWIPKPTRRVPRPSRLPTVIANALAHAFLGIYVDLALLEARIRGAVEATEAVVYVSQSGFVDQTQTTQKSSKVRRTAWRTIKPVIERAAAAATLFLLAPTMLIIALAIKADSRGPVLFRQVRVGRHGTEFGLYKFRTMVVNADALWADLVARNELDGLMFKMREDPRVTRVGRLLRRRALDELPSLINVLLGTLSIVGPRPALPAEVAGYEDQERSRLAVNPGLTGFWQVSGGSDLSWDEGVELDLAYVEDGSFRTDLSILIRTLGAVAGGRGMY